MRWLLICRTCRRELTRSDDRFALEELAFAHQLDPANVGHDVEITLAELEAARDKTRVS